MRQGLLHFNGIYPNDTRPRVEPEIVRFVLDHPGDPSQGSAVPQHQFSKCTSVKICDAICSSSPDPFLKDGKRKYVANLGAVFGLELMKAGRITHDNAAVGKSQPDSSGGFPKHCEHILVA